MDQYNWHELCFDTMYRGEIAKMELMQHYDFSNYAVWSEFLHNSFEEEWMPTECVVETPKYVVPKAARIYSTWRWLVQGKILTYGELRERPDFSGTAAFKQNEILMIENWSNWGADGHIEWHHRGYFFVDRKTFEKNMQFNQRYPSITRASHFTWFCDSIEVIYPGPKESMDKQS